MRDRPVATEKIAVLTAVRLGFREGADKRRGIVRRRFMANIASQIKRNQRSLRERADTEQRRLVQLIDKAVKRGALHRNSGARKKSRAARLRRSAAKS